jgi:hypothetical protein
MTDATTELATGIVAKLDAALLELHSLESIVSSFAPEKQTAVEESFMRSARALEEIEAASGSLEGVEVPLRLLEWVDQGKDPDAFYQQLFQEAIWTAQARLYARMLFMVTCAGCCAKNSQHVHRAASVVAGQCALQFQRST